MTQTIRQRPRIERRVQVNGTWVKATDANLLAALQEAIDRVAIDDDISAFAVGLSEAGR